MNDDHTTEVPGRICELCGIRGFTGDICPHNLQVQYAALPSGLLVSTSDGDTLARLGLSDSFTAPCGATIPTCAVADGKTRCGCGNVHEPQIYGVNLPAIFQELADLRARVETGQPEDALQHPLPCCGECGEFQWRQWCQNCGNNHPMPTVQAYTAPDGYVLINFNDLSDVRYRILEGGMREDWRHDALMRLDAAINGYDDLPTEAQTNATRD